MQGLEAKPWKALGAESGSRCMSGSTGLHLEKELAAFKGCQ